MEGCQNRIWSKEFWNVEYTFLYMWLVYTKSVFWPPTLFILHLTIRTQIWLDPYILFLLLFVLSLFYFLPFFFLPKVALCCCCCCQLCNSLFTGCQQAEVHSHFLQISVLPAEINSDIPPQKKYSKINCHDEPCLKQNKTKSPGSLWRGCGDLTCFVYMFVGIFLWCSRWKHYCTNLFVDGLNFVL